MNSNYPADETSCTSIKAYKKKVSGFFRSGHTSTTTF